MFRFNFFNIFTAVIMSIFIISVASYAKEELSADEEVFKYREMLKNTGDYQINYLRDVLLLQRHHPDAIVRFNVSEAFGEMREPEMLEVLWDMARNDPELIVRIGAVEGMALTESDSALKYFILLLRDPDFEVRDKAALGCGLLGNESILNDLEEIFLQEKNLFTRITLAAAIYKISRNSRNGGFIEDVINGGQGMEAKKYVFNVLSSMDANFDYDVLSKAFYNEKNDDVKISVAFLMARQGSEDALLYLKNSLEKADEVEYKIEALKAVSELGEQEYAYPYLIQALESKNSDVREMVVEEFVEFNNFPIVPLLGEVLLNDENSVVREIAAWVMGEQRREDALIFLKQGLYDTDADVRTGSLAAIYKIITDKIIDAQAGRGNEG